MPEIAEVETVRNTLKLRILNKKITKVNVFYQPIVLNEISDFNRLVGESFLDIYRKGKWLIFETEHFYLCSHLRMEGKYFIKTEGDTLERHEHVEIIFSDHTCLRYHDTRKFGRMKLMKKEELCNFEGIQKQGIEPIDENLTKEYVFEKIKRKQLPLKTILLDQTIISGLGNIYADEVLFSSGLSPFQKGCETSLEECGRICISSKDVITKAIEMGGTTIRSYTSSLGVTGRFQQFLKVHSRAGEPCLTCGKEISRRKVGGRSTYFCEKCQHVKKQDLKKYDL